MNHLQQDREVVLANKVSVATSSTVPLQRRDWFVHKIKVIGSLKQQIWIFIDSLPNIALLNLFLFVG